MQGSSLIGGLNYIIYFLDDKELTLHGLHQFYVKLDEATKNRKLTDLLDALNFNQVTCEEETEVDTIMLTITLPIFRKVVIFVSKPQRAKELSRLLEDCNFPSICIHGHPMKQEERISRFKLFKDFHKRILVSTDLFGRGIDIERVNIVINYDFPDQSDQYLHRVGRAGRFGTKGLAISFISSDTDGEIFQKVQSRFAVSVPELPDSIEESLYMNA